MGPVTAHIAGKLTLHCGVFLGGTFTPEASINSPVAMIERDTQRETVEESDRNNKKERRRHERESNSSVNLLCSS